MKTKRNIFKLLFFIVLVINLTLVAIISFSASDKNWIIKIISDNNKETTLDLDGFKSFFEAMIEMNYINQPIPVNSDDIKQLMNNKSTKERALSSYVEYRLLLNEIIRKNIVDRTEIQNKAKKLTDYIEAQLLINEYGKRMLLNKAKVSDKEVDDYLSTKDGKIIIEKMGLDDARSYVKKNCILKKMDQLYSEKITELKDKNSITYNKKLIEKIKF